GLVVAGGRRGGKRSRRVPSAQLAIHRNAGAQRASSETASASRSSAVRKRLSQIAGLPLCSANSRYQAANSRNFRGSSTSLSLGATAGGAAQYASRETSNIQANRRCRGATSRVSSPAYSAAYCRAAAAQRNPAPTPA